jgi:hypothetical protein
MKSVVVVMVSQSDPSKPSRGPPVSKHIFLVRRSDANEISVDEIWAMRDTR